MPRVSSKEASKRPRVMENPAPRTTEEFQGNGDADGPLSTHGLSDEEQTFNNMDYGTLGLQSEDDLHHKIAEKAFSIYEARGFENGYALDHWLEAERQVKGVGIGDRIV